MADSLLGRRSSRAKPTQSRSHISSATSSTSGRSTRAFAKTGSPQKSTGSASLSSEPPDDPNDEASASLRRRSMRGKDELDREPKAKIELLEMAPISGDEVGEDDEAVRCVCGHDDYPGPPPYDSESKYGLKDVIEFERIFGIEITDEIAGNFVQCEVCNSWQHSACVGFTTEESGPDDVEYFCEHCRKDLHKVYTAGNGQKYSIFLPIHRTSRAVSRATSAAKEGARSRSPKPTPNPNGKMSRAAAAAAAAAVTSKRRSTMNSRDAAYDEEEQLRRAIEASKEDNSPEGEQALLAARRAIKRVREESEENQENPKRQRTDSKSPSPTSDKAPPASVDESDDESLMRNGSKKSRNTVRTQREKTERDERREEQERKRAEAASKRKGRAERRRADDSDPADEIPPTGRAGTARATESAQPPDPPPSSIPTPDTPPATQPPASSHKKKATSQHKKGKGRNQYTKDRDTHENDESPARSMSREVGRNVEDNHTSHSKGSGHDGPARSSHKAKGGMNSRVTLTDLRRRASGILDYIGRTQVELASEPLSESQPNSTHSATEDDRSAVSISNTKTKSDSPSKGPEQPSSITNGTSQSKEFKEMSCVEMMDSLTRDLVKWQQEFAS